MLLHLEEWSGTSDELVDVVNDTEELLGVLRSRPMSKRTLTYYRTKGVTGHLTGKKYTFIHLIQCILARKLSQDGWKIQQISDSVPRLSQSQIIFYLEHPVKFEELFKQATNHKKIDIGETEECLEDKFILTEEILAARMLAKGVLLQFMRVENQLIVDGTNIPKELRQAMSLLGKLRINEGLADNCSSIHEVLSRCNTPLSHASWGITKFQHDKFLFRDSVLIDPDHRCPTQDCIEMAEIYSDSDLRERYSFEEFANLCGSFGGRRHQVYTLIRRFLVENPIVESEKLLSYVKEHQLQKADSFLRLGCYRPIQTTDLINGRLYRCSCCSNTLRGSKASIGRCSIKQCGKFSVEQHLRDGSAPTSSLLILKSHLQVYWFGPAIDELRIFHKADSVGLICNLFPNSDQCDISVNGFDLGIDVKSYQSPRFLAQKLSKSIGGLSEYNKRIIAVNDNLLQQQSNYMKTLESLYSGPEALNFMSVSDVLNWLEGL